MSQQHHNGQCRLEAQRKSKPSGLAHESEDLDVALSGEVVKFVRLSFIQDFHLTAVRQEFH